MEITQEVLEDRYDYYDGHLYNRRQFGPMAPEDEQAGNVMANGRILIGIKGKYYLEHRLIFLYHHGYLPKELDHINRDKTDNRIENLREASSSQNKANTRLRKNNTSGYKGVYYITTIFRSRPWQAQIRIDGNNIHLGFFATAEEAAEAYDDAAIELFGEFAKTNESLGLL